MRRTEIPDEIISLEEARLFLRLDASGSPATHPEDQLVQSLITAAREAAENYTQKALAYGEFVEILPGFPVVITLVAPTISVTSIYYVDQDNVSQLLDPSEYEVVDNVIYPVTAWPATATGRATVTVTFQAGYTDLISPNDYPMPVAIRQAMLLMIGHMYENRESVCSAEKYEVPMGAHYLMTPYRTGMGL